MKRIYRKAISAIKKRDEIWFPVFISTLSLILIIIVLIITNSSNKSSTARQILNEKTSAFCVGQIYSECNQVKIRQAINIFDGELEEKVGVLPEKKLYFLKIWRENISLNAGNKDKKGVELLYRRALEAHIEILNGNVNATKTALKGFEKINGNIQMGESDKSNLRTIFGYLSKEADYENRNIILNILLTLND